MAKKHQEPPTGRTITTTLHAYCFDIRKPDQAAAYAKLRKRLTALGLKCFETHGGASHYRPDLAGSVELETAHLFDNQWNTAPILRAQTTGAADRGARVFDWAQDFNSAIGAPKGIKRGHWLEQTPEMAEIRRNTLKCGYCGHLEPAAAGSVFCSHCIDSEYLTEDDVRKGAVRMVPIDAGTGNWRALTEAEAAHWIPQYRKAQVEGSTVRGRARLAAARADIAETYRRQIEAAEHERAGKTWICDNAPGLLANYIYYPHSAEHCFGWRKPLGLAEREALTAFPHAWKEGK